ncbi:hypothetical protein Tco_1076870 [Tanacetum coccineum]
MSVLSSFGNQFLNLSSDTSLIGTTKECAYIKINSLLDIQIQQEVPHIQSPFILTLRVSVIPEPTILSPIPEIPIVTPVTTLLPPPSVTNITHVLQQQTTPIPTVPISTAAPTATIVPDPLLVIVQRVSKLEKDVQELKQVDDSPTILKIIRSQVPAAVDKYLGSKESVSEPIEEVIMDDANDNVVNGVDQPQDKPPTSDPEWNKGKEVDNGQEQTWFNDMLSAEKALLTFDELITTPIDFSNFAMNRMKIDKLTKAHLVGPVYELLKGTCETSIKLEYNIEECYKALSDQLDWNNPKGDCCPFDLSKPLPLKVHSGHLTVASEYFFNNDLEYLKSPDPEKQYTMSITKIKAARYELVGIEDMIPNLWSVTKILKT